MEVVEGGLVPETGENEATGARLLHDPLVSSLFLH